MQLEGEHINTFYDSEAEERFTHISFSSIQWQMYHYGLKGRKDSIISNSERRDWEVAAAPCVSIYGLFK